MEVCKALTPTVGSRLWCLLSTDGISACGRARIVYNSGIAQSTRTVGSFKVGFGLWLSVRTRDHLLSWEERTSRGSNQFNNGGNGG